MSRPSPRARLYAAFFVLAATAAAASCSSAGGSDVSGASPPTTGNAGTSAGGGHAPDAGTAGSTGTSGSGGSAASAGGIIVGNGGSDAGVVDGGGLQDALPDTGMVDACSDAAAVPGPYVHTCAAQTENECDGNSDTNPSFPNGAFGNGFDDDCDGLVDEGCKCDDAHAPGTTKPCYLLPASQADTSGMPVGWCKENSAGTMACVQTGSGEFASKSWDGYCKGAQPPFADDACAPGDFDCDGVDANSKTQDCSCPTVQVTCPTEPVVISPYPDPTDITKKKPNPYDPHPNDPFIVDGNAWIQGGAASMAANWKWTITGGDCDNILPHPTFAIYNGPNTQTAGRFGVETPNVGSNHKQRGLVLGPIPAGQGGHQIWPAFSLSGDYVVQGEFDLAGQHYSCTIKVQVRAPGLRAEMCWDMKDTTGIGVSDSDLDLHFGRLQGASCSEHGWFDTCGKAPSSDDCFYQCDSGCRTGNQGFCFGQPTPAPGWGYAASGNDACHGWGSLREPQQTCDNPRLDRDNLGCNVTVTNPLQQGTLQDPTQEFCGPENINLDNPNAGDRFAVGVHYYAGQSNHPHVNIYCNGERKLALGYDPTTTPPTTFPTMTQAFNPGQTASFYAGDFWEVARVTWKGDAMDPCTIEPIPSKMPKNDKDGNANICVDTNAQNIASPQMSDAWLYGPGGGYPADAAGLCWH